MNLSILIVIQLIAYALLATTNTNALQYSGILIGSVPNNTYQISSYNVESNQFTTLFIDQPNTIDHLLKYDNETSTIVYISCPIDKTIACSLVYTDLESGTQLKSFQLPLGSYNWGHAQLSNDQTQFYCTMFNTINFKMYLFNLADGSQESSFEIDYPSFLFDINKGSVLSIFDFTTNRAVSIYIFNGVQSSQSPSDLLQCSYWVGCTYLFVADLQKQSVLSSVQLPNSFESYYKGFSMSSFTGNTITAIAGFSPNIYSLDIVSGNLTSKGIIQNDQVDFEVGFLNQDAFMITNYFYNDTQTRFLIFDYQNQEIYFNLSTPTFVGVYQVLPY